MEGAILEVNLCPSTNIGKATCSVHSAKEMLFSKTENQAVVRLNHSVTAVCPENGEIQFTTIIPDENIEYNGKSTFIEVESTRGHNKRLKITSETQNKTSHSVGEHGSRDDAFQKVSTETKFIPQGEVNKRSKEFLSGKRNEGTRNKGTKQHDPRKRLYESPKSRENPGISKRNNGLGNGSLWFGDELSTSRKRKNSHRSDSGSEDEKKPRKNKQWCESNMLKAIKAVQNGMRVRTAAKQFAVPRTTLKYKLDSRRTEVPKKSNWSGDLNERIIKATKKYMDAKYGKKELKTPIKTQQDNKIKTDIGNKGTNSKESNLLNKFSVTSYEKKKEMSFQNGLPPVQLSRSLRSNSNVSTNEDVQPEKVTDVSENSKVTTSNKEFKGKKILDSLKKKDKANQSTCDKDLTNTCKKNPEHLRKNDEKNCMEKRCFKLWSEEAMKQAIHAVEKGCKIRNAAMKYGVPRSTLGRRLTSTQRRLHSLAKNPTYYNHSFNDSGGLLTGINLRQSPRRQRVLPAIETAQKDPGIQVSTTSAPHTEVDVKKSVESVKGPEIDEEDETTKGRKKLKNWSEETMEKALEAVKKGMTIRSAAKKFNLPRASLKTRKYKRDSVNTTYEGPEPHISPEDEDQLVNYVNNCATFGIVNVRQVGLLLAAEAAEKKQIWNVEKQGLPPDEWWDSFCSRRGSHIKNVDVTLPNAQTRKLTEAKLSLFYDKLSALKNSSQYHKTPIANCSDCRLFTVQEFKYDLNDVTQWVNEGTDHADKTLPMCDPANKLVSTICCASAAGNSIPPMFVYHTENGYQIPGTGLVGPFGAFHFVRQVHDLTRKSDYYYKWFDEVFLKYAPQSRPLIVLFDPYTAFITPELIQLADTNEIILLGLPPFSPHVVQPLYRTVFPALKKGFTFTSSLFKRIFVKGVTFNNFARCFKVAWNSSVDAVTIKTGFAKAGIHPINRQVILKSQLQLF